MMLNSQAEDKLHSPSAEINVNDICVSMIISYTANISVNFLKGNTIMNHGRL